MKKLFIILLIFPFVFSTCDLSDKDTDNLGEIGKTGPGGGIIFFAEGGQYMECSGELGNTTWATAVITARTHNGGGFTDWRLPNRGELDLMYKNLKKNNLGGFSNNEYWTSIEYSSSSAYTQRFSDGRQNYYEKNNSFGVRAVRAFTTEPENNTTLRIRNDSFIEITDVFWNNVSFTIANETIKIGSNVIKNVESGMGYVYFRRAGNPVLVRTNQFVILNDEEENLFIINDNTIVVEVNNSSNTNTLRNIFTKPWIVVRQGSNIINLYGEYNFGSILQGKVSDITFTIENIGLENLNLITVDGNRINIRGNDIEQFSIIQQPLAASIGPGNTNTFTIRFNPATIGNNYFASVHIGTNSINAEEFAFNIRGNGRNYIIGDTGPGGGIIFFASGNQFKECSGELGSYIWDDAMTIASSYQGGGFTDWYLPDRGELDLIYLNRMAIGNFLNNFYWTSSESDYYINGAAFSVNFNSINMVVGDRYVSPGGQAVIVKSNSCRVRAVRSFTTIQ